MLAEWRLWKERVEQTGVQCLPGCSVRTGKLLHLARKATSKGLVTKEAFRHVVGMFTTGSTLYCDYDALENNLCSTKVFKNYKTATENRKGVTQGIRKRVEASQTLCLGKFDRQNALQLLPPKSIVFPLGGGAKEKSRWNADGRMAAGVRPHQIKFQCVVIATIPFVDSYR